MPDTAERRREELVGVFREARACTRCELSASRTQVVFGAGNADADLMLVGEAPGAEEDRQGLPFVGRSGALLTQLLEEAGLSRGEVFIANTLKCRPPANRDPSPLEIETCRPWLFEQIRLIEPKVVATLGNFATKLLSGDPTGITRVRGVPRARRLGQRTVWLYPLFHPAAALRSTGTADLLRQDIASLPSLLNRDAPADEEAGGPV
jgi:uracil-DNA glycosylase family 4